MKRLLAVLTCLIISLAAASAAVAAPPAPAGAQAVASAPDGLRITSGADTERVSGTFVRGADLVRFSGERRSPVSAAANLSVNGKAFYAWRDLRAGVAAWGGHGAALVPDDRAAMRGVVKALHGRWLAPRVLDRRALPAHQDLLTRLSMLLAEAPLGVRLSEQRVARPTESTTPKTVAGTRRAAAEACLAEVMASLPAHQAASAQARQEAARACQVADDDGIRYLPCSAGYRTLCHDAGGHCFLCESIHAGPGSANCMGRCGPGCTALNTWTYDCGDHDRCGRVHGGSTNPWDSECGDEYWDADDDFLWAIRECA